MGHISDKINVDISHPIKLIVLYAQCAGALCGLGSIVE